MTSREPSESPSPFDAIFDGAKVSLNAQEVAELLGVSRPTVLSWINAKSIPAYRLGGNSHWMIFREELREVFRRNGNGFTFPQVEEVTREAESDSTTDPEHSES